MLRTLLVTLLLSFSAPALAIFKCEIAGKVTYSDEPCPGGKTVIANGDTVSSLDATKAKQQLAQDKREVERLEKARHQREKKEEKEQQQAARSANVKKAKCTSLEQRKKWADEDAAHATGKSADNAKRKARRATEKYEVECKAHAARLF